MIKAATLGVIVGNRGFFPGHLSESGRKTILEVLEQEGIRAVCLTPEDTQYGAVFSIEDSRKCAELFKAHREEIDGILVTCRTSARKPRSPTRCAGPAWTCRS